MTGERAPHADDEHLLGLRVWIDRITTDYENSLSTGAPRDRRQRKRYLRRLRALRDTYEGASRGPGKDCVRGLLASGVVRYGRHCPLPESALPEALMLDFIVDALWPLVIAPRLPASWYGDLAEITSPMLARFVSYARTEANAGGYVSRRSFQEKLADKRFAFGIMNLLIDLNDPRRGASHLAAVAAAARRPEPPRNTDLKVLIGWIFAGASGAAGAAVTGVIGNRADALVLKLWHWLEENTANETLPPDVDYPHHSGHGFLDHTPSGGHHSSGLADIVGDFVHRLFG